jgi:hypothetical protein
MLAPSRLGHKWLAKNLLGGLQPVSENRAKADGWTIRVFVLRVLPPREEHPEDPVFTLGGNVGEAAEIGGSTPVAARLHRIAYVIDTRPLRAPRPLICVRYGSRGDRS